MQPDEETGSAEEQPVSNMAVPRLETVEYRSRSTRDGFSFTRIATPLRKPLPSVGEKRLVDCDIGQCSVEGLMVHSDTAHQCQHRCLIGHRGSHARHPAEVTVQTLDPVGGVDHCLYLRGVVKISHIRLVVEVVAQELDGSVVLAPPVAHFLPLSPCHFDCIVALSGTEYIPKIGGKSGLVAMSDLGGHVAFEMGYTALQWCAGELLSDNGVKPLDAVCHHQADSLHSALLQFVEDVSPSGGAFLRHVEYAENLAGAFLRHGQSYIERLCRNRTLTMDLDVDAVNEHHRIVFLQSSLKPFVDLGAYAFNHTADA